MEKAKEEKFNYNIDEIFYRYKRMLRKIRGFKGATFGGASGVGKKPHAAFIIFPGPHIRNRY